MPWIIPPNSDIHANIDIAENMSFSEWYAAVRWEDIWDCKQIDPSYEQFGNFNFVATGSALGLPDKILYQGAGWAQTKVGTSKPEWGDPGDLFEIFGKPVLNPWGGTKPYGDDPMDTLRPFIRDMRGDGSKPRDHRQSYHALIER